MTRIPSTKSMQQWMSRFLLIGTLTAMAMVMVGGFWYLAREGHAPLHTELLITAQPTSLLSLFQGIQNLTPLSLIGLGLGLLIAEQVLRMVWLLVFYVMAQDRWFIFFSGFILSAISYSLFLMH